MTTATQPTIESITIKKPVDEWPDLSYLGKYSSDPGPNSTMRTIDRKARGDMERNDLRYFHPATEYSEQDYARYEAYNRGEWWMVGIRAEATIKINGQLQTITSGGLWGIESDGGTGYQREVALDELADLRLQLEALNVDLGNFDELTDAAAERIGE